MSVCIEKKLLLAGGFHEYRCELLHYSGRFGMLKYVVDRPYVVADITIEPGEVTHALYWTDRTYTLYTWHLHRTGRKLYYFNIADSVSLSPQLFVWRDLIEDILIDDSGKLTVLDKEDFPPDLDLVLRTVIGQAERHIIAHHPAIIAEVEKSLAGIAGA